MNSVPEKMAMAKLKRHPITSLRETLIQRKERAPTLVNEKAQTTPMNNYCPAMKLKSKPRKLTEARVDLGHPSLFGLPQCVLSDPLASLRDLEGLGGSLWLRQGQFAMCASSSEPPIIKKNIVSQPSSSIRIPKTYIEVSLRALSRAFQFLLHLIIFLLSLHKPMVIQASILSAMKFDAGFDVDFEPFSHCDQIFQDILLLCEDQGLRKIMNQRIKLPLTEIKKCVYTLTTPDDSSIVGTISGQHFLLTPAIIS
ncbi:hypothetical protein KSP39_PZI007920 [Platanthera zijinensis]|uniref:Uncharacterized protein n=1 Tax=Platanthera zijinensis TaxID=2320716 RepID=A0AAP0G8T2_9ASPA